MADSLYQLQLDYIRKAALARGIDPNVAVKAMRGEGLAPGVWQSNFKQPYGRERSYGAMQLHVAPEGARPGMGNDFVRDTGLNPADPKNYKQMIDYGLDNVVKKGWGPWYGAKAQGITGMMGVGDNAQVMPASYQTPGPVTTARRDELGTGYSGRPSPASGPQGLPSLMTAGAAARLRGEEPGALSSQFKTGVGPRSLQQALEMQRMKTSIVDPAAKKMSEWKDWLTKAVGGDTASAASASSPVNPTVVPVSAKPNILDSLRNK